MKFTALIYHKFHHEIDNSTVDQLKNNSENNNQPIKTNKLYTVWRKKKKDYKKKLRENKNKTFIKMQTHK